MGMWCVGTPIWLAVKFPWVRFPSSPLMSETIRIERVLKTAIAVVREAEKPLSWPLLRKRIEARIGRVRDGDFRSAVWQMVDGGSVEFVSATCRDVQLSEWGRLDKEAFSSAELDEIAEYLKETGQARS